MRSMCQRYAAADGGLSGCFARRLEQFEEI